MKKNVHPKYYDKAVITCSCGAVFKIGSTREKMQVEICSACHPFYTGKKKIVDTTGRVDRFKKLAEKATAKKLARRSLSEGGEAAKKAKAVKKEKTGKKSSR